MAQLLKIKNDLCKCFKYIHSKQFSNLAADLGPVLVDLLANGKIHLLQHFRKRLRRRRRRRRSRVVERGAAELPPAFGGSGIRPPWRYGTQSINEI